MTCRNCIEGMCTARCRGEYEYGEEEDVEDSNNVT